MTISEFKDILDELINEGHGDRILTSPFGNEKYIMTAEIDSYVLVDQTNVLIKDNNIKEGYKFDLKEKHEQVLLFHII